MDLGERIKSQLDGCKGQVGHFDYVILGHRRLFLIDEERGEERDEKEEECHEDGHARSFEKWLPKPN